MQIKITNLTNGSYDVLGNLLYFKDEKSDVTINKKAALEIMHTLIDSVDLLDNYAEDLIYKIEDKIYEE